MNSLNEILSFLEAIDTSRNPIKTKYNTFIIPLNERTHIHYLPITKENLSQYTSLQFTFDLTTDFKKDNIQLIHIWEDQWIHNQESIKSRFKSLFGLTNRIYGRSTVIKKIDMNVTREFLLKNHILTSTKAKFKYGLFHKDELVSVMTLGPKVVFHDGSISYDIIRFCNKNSTTIVGGLSKLFKHALKELQPDHLMTLIDRDWSEGNAFKKLGFEYEETKAPFSFYLDSHLKKRYFMNQLSEEELQDKKYITIHNSGCYKLVWIKRHQ